jgi:hypothetical protein
MNTRSQSQQFDLSSIERIVLLPLGFGGAAPNRRAARWNGKEVRPAPFSTEEALMWESPARYFAFREPTAPQELWIPTFLRFGLHVTGRHTSGSVWIIDEARFRAAIEVTESLMSDDGGHGSTGVGEWSPVLLTMAGSTQVALHIDCLDDSTRTELTRRLVERAGLVTTLTFSRNTFETATVKVNGVSVEGAWSPLSAKDSAESALLGVAGAVKVADVDLKVGIRPRT